MQATTKQLRNIVRNTIGRTYGSWTDKCKSKPDSDERLMAWSVGGDPFALAAQMNAKMRELGFGNVFYATECEGNWAARVSGGSYLRVKALIG